MSRRYPNGAAKNPRDVYTAFKKYIEWNMWGDGKDTMSSRSSAYWYRDDIMYRGWMPVARCIHAKDEGTVLFIRWDQHVGQRRDGDYLPAERVFRVDDICVFGPGQGLAMGREEYFRTLRMQWLSKIDYFVDSAHGLSSRACWQYAEKQKLPAPTDAQRFRYNHYWYGAQHVEYRLDGITNIGDDARRLSNLFKLDWPAFPDNEVKREYLHIIHRKAERYEKLAPQRERRQARKDGEKAFTEAAQ